MKIIKNTYFLQGLNLIALLILLLNILNNSIYTHSHIAENGEIITHAHPFNQQDDNSPIKSHKHTTLEYVVFDLLNIFIPSSFGFILLGTFLLKRKNHFTISTLQAQFSFFNNKNKSPPFKIVI